METAEATQAFRHSFSPALQTHPFPQTFEQWLQVLRTRLLSGRRDLAFRGAADGFCSRGTPSEERTRQERRVNDVHDKAKQSSGGQTHLVDRLTTAPTPSERAVNAEPGLAPRES